jgi:hypothetical protein
MEQLWTKNFYRKERKEKQEKLGARCYAQRSNADWTLSVPALKPSRSLRSWRWNAFEVLACLG